MSLRRDSELIAAHLQMLRAMRGRSVSAGWYSTARYPDKAGGSVGIQVARIARLNEYGGTIDHPGGTRYIRDAIVRGRFVGVRFVRNDFPGETEVTKPHRITIPARPFMRYAWNLFSADRAAIQNRIAMRLARGQITPDQALAQIGLALEGYIARSIRTGPWVANSASTVRRKGFNRPLVDTAHMLQSISSRVT
ncbi:RNA polymerase [Pseudomonas phage EPa61]|uniref:Phage protein n=70 Tax=root TaxID=1 RepID=A0A6G9LGZ5_9CAUD|nr:tail completion or Neck1 protein [Pseudomonas phage F8]YP_002154171.1 tail completion or Neck1 protein [Pseudomonas phage LBL3]YP_002154262.1 tail completion or Neck1 protein [Pseudomonas phage LMA2]YP_002364337.1 tail completion or Neck1 protein [Pseudomonas phage 14-1]YP_002418836.1 tail completion or Neck1 protein [Pseudomonas phage SN]YP_006200794.1 tail completion or Neck1 protein [Pseudomonas phage JG024]YP_007002576.1 tail completion or Neck1 protein [Pseudomonas phage NH-4]YP_0092